ncbi:MAG TPA: single-stranded-DNA-specific exonuclease RecJ [Acidiferrobacter sp.]|nr:single-stranded-DNA-specific exonuclease RecJ [Acidiferrobacter sp.]
MTDQTTDVIVTAVLTRLYAARGVFDRHEWEQGLADLLPPHAMLGLDHAAEALAGAIARAETILIVGDYDADGATGTALAVRGLRALGARDVRYLIPDRATEGYGLTAAIVTRAAAFAPTWLLTVDNGINSVEGAQTAKRLGMRLIITDHHLPGDELPEAYAIVNPNQHGDCFESKAISGVGVVLYLLIALRRIQNAPQVSFAGLLDLVALGTVADCVPLDANNRLLVRAGLRRMNAGHACPGIAALLEVSGKRPGEIYAQDLGFQVGPRLNAAGRMADMAVGVRCLLADDRSEAYALAQELDTLNRERRAREATMQSEADEKLALSVETGALRPGICITEAHWHPGIVGILAGRLKERHKRPVIALAPAEAGYLRGSGRSVPALNLRDALASIAERHPGLFVQFGGHAAAAGLSIKAADLEVLAAAFAHEVERRLGPGPYEDGHTDGELHPRELSLALALAVRDGGPWGNGFPEPLFEGVFQVVRAEVIKGQHLRLQLAQAGLTQPVKAMGFRQSLAPEEGLSVRLRYRLGVDDYGGRQALCLYFAEWSRVSLAQGVG